MLHTDQSSYEKWFSLTLLFLVAFERLRVRYLHSLSVVSNTISGDGYPLRHRGKLMIFWWIMYGIFFSFPKSKKWLGGNSFGLKLTTFCGPAYVSCSSLGQKYVLEVRFRRLKYTPKYSNHIRFTILKHMVEDFSLTISLMPRKFDYTSRDRYIIYVCAW